MKIYLAGDGGPKTWVLYDRGSFDDDVSIADTLNKDIAHRVNLLESFYYIADWQTKNLHRFKSFMLDSGVYTFAYGAGVDINFESYTQRYIDYINQNRVELFFEMDADDVLGYEKVLQLRKKIEAKTGRQSIPVWHINRGKNEWLRMCDEYEYVAIGGLTTKVRKRINDFLPWFTREAHKRGCKVHGLGYTDLDKLQASGFDSVDSTAWLYGNIGGYVYKWDGATMRKYKRDGRRIKSKDAARNNFIEWVKMSEDLEKRG